MYGMVWYGTLHTGNWLLLFTHTHNDIKERCGRGKEKSDGGQAKAGSKASLISLKRKVTSFVQASVAMIWNPKGRKHASAHPSFADQELEVDSLLHLHQTDSNLSVLKITLNLQSPFLRQVPSHDTGKHGWPDDPNNCLYYEREAIRISIFFFLGTIFRCLLRAFTSIYVSKHLHDE